MDTQRFKENMREFLRNQPNFPAVELETYAGKHVAWSPDGSQIVASGDDAASLEKAVAETEFDPAECVFSYVPLPDEVFLGGAGL
jgi:hypothetical protein